MATETTVIVHFRGLDRIDELSEALERRCQHLAAEFSETQRFEISLSPDNNEIRANARVTGKSTSISAHATAPHEKPAADAALDRLERELRNRHDKRIFIPRRAARRSTATRRS